VIDGRFAAGFAPATDWWSGHLFCEPPRLGELVRAVAPVAARAHRWFFIYYAEGGMHVRCRLQGPTSRLGALLPALHDAALAAGASAVVPARYERELLRYGGADAIEAAETVFWRSSELAVALQAEDALARRGAAVGWGGLLTAGAYAVAGWQGATARARAQRYGESLSQVLSRTARSANLERAGRVASRWWQLGAAMTTAAAGSLPLPAAAHAYVASLERYLALLGRHAPASVERALDGQIHMTLNRLGLSNLDELDVLYALAASAPEPSQSQAG
jgi:thiopeptide-type bacteriocin biosynthesis protein